MKTIARTLAVLLATACSATEAPVAGAAGDAGNRPIGASEGNTLVVEIREGHSDNRDLYCVTWASGGTGHGSECATVGAALPEQVSSFDEHREACRLICELGVERLRPLGVASDMADDRRNVVPAPDFSLIVVLTALGRVDQVVETAGGSERHDLMSVLSDGLSEVSWSADSRWVAARTTDRIGHVDRDGLVVMDVVRGAIPLERRVGRSVGSIAWSPDSQNVAVLVSTERLGSGPIESLGKAFGHGVPYVDVSLLIVDVASGSECEVVVARDVKYGDGSVMWDPLAVEAQPN